MGNTPLDPKETVLEVQNERKQNRGLKQIIEAETDIVSTKGLKHKCSGIINSLKLLPTSMFTDLSNYAVICPHDFFTHSEFFNVHEFEGSQHMNSLRYFKPMNELYTIN